MRPTRHRVRMAELACAGEPRFEVSRLEQGTSRSYSIDTIEKVKRTIAPDDELFFIIGADAFAEIRTWHRWEDVARAVRFIVVSRPGGRYDLPAGMRVDRLDSVDMPVSSSQIRTALAAGESPSEVPAEVLSYIRDHGLYRVPKSPPNAATPLSEPRPEAAVFQAIIVAVRYTHCVGLLRRSSRAHRCHLRVRVTRKSRFLLRIKHIQTKMFEGFSEWPAPCMWESSAASLPVRIALIVEVSF